MIQSINKKNYELRVIGNITNDINELNTQLINIIKNMMDGIDCKAEIQTLKNTFEEVKVKPRHYSGPDEHDLDRHYKPEWDCDISDVRNEIGTILDFETYCMHLIENYNDVIILTNEQFRICQVVITDPSQVYREIHIYTDNIITFGFGWEYAQGDIIDVFDEDTEYFYGINKGVMSVIHKTNCQVLDHNVSTSINTFILNDNIIQAILYKVLKLERITKKTVLLFEYQTCLQIDKKYLNTVHSHNQPDYDDDQNTIDYSDTCSICASFKKGDFNINNSKLLFYMPNSYNTQDFTTRTEYGGFTLHFNPINIVKRRLPNVMYENLISLLLSNNNFNRKTALVNFKFLFTKTVQQELQLIKDINNTLENKNIKLIDLFFPEIKFLLSKHLLEKIKPIDKKIDDRDWLMYCETNGVSSVTKPEFFLTYLFDVVLVNIIPVKMRNKILMNVTELIKQLLVDLGSPDRLFNYDTLQRLVTRQINTLIKKIIEEQKGGLGKLKSRKKKHIKKHSRRLYS